MQIRVATPNDAKVLAELAIQMWCNHTLAELEADFVEIVSNKDAVCFLKYVDDIPVGFAQCQLRHDYVEGTHSSPVGYLEGIFLFPNISTKAMPRNCCTNVNYGQKKKAAQNLQATVNLTI